MFNDNERGPEQSNKTPTEASDNFIQDFFVEYGPGMVIGLEFTLPFISICASAEKINEQNYVGAVAYGILALAQGTWLTSQILEKNKNNK